MNFWRISFTLLFLSTLAARGADHAANLRIEPYAFADHPQLWLQTIHRLSNLALESPWFVQLRLELETETERNRSFDFDRVWMRATVEDSGEWTWGRIHPWEISLHPGSGRSWGLEASLQPQTRGALLGEGMDNSTVFPNPLLTGWAGAHYWNDPTGAQPFQWGFSASPVFVPTLGGSFDFDRSRSIRQGRFARHAGTHATEHGTIPLRYELPPGEIKDVVLQPQVMAQAYADWDALVKGSETWFWIAQAPQADPQPGPEPLRIENTPEGPIALAKPVFPRRWMGAITTVWTPENFRNYSFFSSMTYRDDPRWGLEIGARNPFIQISVMGERKYSKTPDDGYTDLLIQYEGRYPLRRITPFWGAKHHLQIKDAWLRTGVRYEVSPSARLETGLDIFAGDTGSYFQQWQDNDRLYFVFLWTL